MSERLSDISGSMYLRESALDQGRDVLGGVAHSLQPIICVQLIHDPTQGVSQHQASISLLHVTCVCAYMHCTSNIIYSIIVLQIIYRVLDIVCLV